MNTIPTLYLDGILSVVRHLLTTASGVLLSAGYLSKEQGTQFVDVGAGALTLAVTIGFSLWQKHTAKKKLVVALAAADMTEKTVELIVATPGTGAPSVLTSPEVVPVSPAPK